MARTSLILSSVEGKYTEALAWIRREDSVVGGIPKVEPTPFEYWAFTTNTNDMALHEEVIERYDSLLEAILHLAKTYPNGVDTVLKIS